MLRNRGDVFMLIKMAAVGLAFALLVFPVYHLCAQIGNEPTGRLIPFQGHLTRPSPGNPRTFETVPDGQYDIVFALYKSPAGGESKVSWGPERHEGVTVVDGLVNVLLGSIVPLPGKLDLTTFAVPLYVGITVDVDRNPATTDLEMVPRQVLLPAAFAIGAANAALLDGVDWTGLLANGARDPRVGTILGAKLENNSVPAGKLGANAVARVNIQDQAVNSAKIENGSMLGEDIGGGQIAASHLVTALQNSLAQTGNRIAALEAQIPPVGSIVAYRGNLADLSDNWKLCDGENDTPNLVGRYLRGIGADPSQLGVEVGVDQTPNHVHAWSQYLGNPDRFQTWQSDGDAVSFDDWGNGFGAEGEGHAALSKRITENNTITYYTLSGGGGDNRPESTQLYFIMRVR